MAHLDPQWSLRDPNREGWQIRAEISPKWIRVKFGGDYIADSKEVMVVTETGRLPVYYFPLKDVNAALFQPSEKLATHPQKGIQTFWDITSGGRTARNAVWTYSGPQPEAHFLHGYVSFSWSKMDGWFEEEEEVFVHARDPYTRVDAIPASRHVQLEVNGIIVADSRRPVILYETGLTPRYYLPAEDVRLDLLQENPNSTRCPYKGIATYWTAAVNGREYEDLVWSYKEPLPEVHEIAGLLCFYHEAADALYVDGIKWSLNSEERLPYRGSEAIYIS
ncbi:DUF427 domain-containing protein [Paenibacillus riograndensis]|uniref:DUF427 domain-containing protein n=2 Tax=Paenibacillus riograndensis TaxID=483937 RepID=A0A0E4HA40_9BACL|nr:DUF427 domain-containing protein [Paenibacillus riograndensis]CQR55610.1 hypothetical protein PRIO_3207 [Paenibacillus riograndensis SBR5]